MAKFIILDTETTGTGDSDRIIQLGFFVLDGKEIEVYEDFCKPDMPVSVEAMEVHHITPEKLQDKPTCKDTKAYKKLCELNTPDNYMIIHNAPFDLAMLAKEDFILKMKLIDTLRCAKHVYEDEKAYRLQYFRYKLDIYKQEQQEASRWGVKLQAHDALGDVLILKLFLSKLKQAVKDKFPKLNPVEQMIELTKKPVFIKTFKFGKYKGQSLADIAKEDAGYLRWMITSMDNIDEDLRYSIKTVLST